MRRWPGVRPRAPRVGRDLLAAIRSVLSLPQPDGASAGRAASRLVARMDPAQDELLGRVSHELRTPVTTIYGNSQLLVRHLAALPMPERQMVADIAVEAERLLGLVDNLLMLARIESGAPVYREPLLLTHHVRGTCEDYAARHRLAIHFEVRGDGDVVVEADRVHVTVLLANLLGNAVAYSPPGADIQVVLEATPDEARVTLLDRGIGLGHEAERHFAEPFYRGAEARRMASGMGIGLTVCSRILAAHGGRLWARARPGGGTEAGFGLPRVMAAESD